MAHAAAVACCQAAWVDKISFASFKKPMLHLHVA